MNTPKQYRAIFGSCKSQKRLLAITCLALTIALVPSWAKTTKHHNASATKRPAAKQSTVNLPRVVLGDRVSSVLLPPGWRHSNAQRFPTSNGEGYSSNDEFIYGSAQSSLMITTIPLTPSAEELAKVRNPQKYHLPGKPYRLGGLPGTFKREGKVIVITAMREHKFYEFRLMAENANFPGSGTLVRSFRPR